VSCPIRDRGAHFNFSVKGVAPDGLKQSHEGLQGAPQAEKMGTYRIKKVPTHKFHWGSDLLIPKQFHDSQRTGYGTLSFEGGDLWGGPFRWGPLDQTPGGRKSRGALYPTANGGKSGPVGKF